METRKNSYLNFVLGQNSTHADYHSPGASQGLLDIMAIFTLTISDAKVWDSTSQLSE